MAKGKAAAGDKSIWTQEENYQEFLLEDAFNYFLGSVNTYAPKHPTVMVGFSGGKDSTATAVSMAYAVLNGLVDLKPEQVHFTYSDTRQELPPLHENAVAFLEYLQTLGFNTHIVRPRLDKRFYVQMIGRGLPKPWALSRWCVTSLKVGAMDPVVRSLYADSNNQKILVITGVRKGESNARDARIDVICKKDGECGTGMFQEGNKYYVRLAPLLPWKKCHVFDMCNGLLTGYPRMPKELVQFSRKVAKIYGEQDIRTGCNACPVVADDTSLRYVVERFPEYAYLAPILRLRELWDDLRNPNNRHYRLFNDGTAKTQSKDLGPYTFEARKMISDFVDGVQAEMNMLAAQAGIPTEKVFQIINAEERARIAWHWEHKSWPNGWDGTQPVGNQEQLFFKRHGSQLTMFGSSEGEGQVEIDEEENMFDDILDHEMFGE